MNSKINKQQQLNRYLEEVCQKGLVRGVFPGVAAAVSVGEKNNRIWGEYYGGITSFNSPQKVINGQTFFDLASLTKPLCTTLAIMSLVEKGDLSLDQPLSFFFKIPEASKKKNIKIVHLLSHCSGFPAYNPYFEHFSLVFNPANQQTIIDEILKEPLEYITGSECRYSDLGFILLGEIVKRITGMGLDDYFAQTITDPLQLSDLLFFRPITKGSGGSDATMNNIYAATEDCGWRKRVVQGEVHDENCWLMGGVAGHAGLFGTLGGVRSLCEHILDQWQGKDLHQAYGKESLSLFLRKYDGKNWCLGFDTPSATGSSSGQYFSKESVGHLGFSGTSFWIDPKRNIVVVLLTNRIHTSRKNVKIRKFRPIFHDWVMEKIESLDSC